MNDNAYNVGFLEQQAHGLIDKRQLGAGLSASVFSRQRTLSSLLRVIETDSKSTTTAAVGFLKSLQDSRGCTHRKLHTMGLDPSLKTLNDLDEAAAALERRLPWNTHSPAPMLEERSLLSYAKILDYQNATSGLCIANDAMQAAALTGKGLDQQMVEGAVAAITQLKLCVLFAAWVLSEAPGIAEDARAYFALLPAGLLRQEIKRNVDRAADLVLEDIGKGWEDGLDKVLPGSAFIAMSTCAGGSRIPKSVSELRNQVMALIRRERSKELLHEDPLVPERESDPKSTDFAHRLELEDEYQARKRCAGLTTAESEILELQKQGLTDEEIASVRHCTPGAVKSLWSRTRKKLGVSR